MEYLNYYPNLTRDQIVWSKVTEVAGLKTCIEIEALQTPVKRGASLRTHRLWLNGQLASGRSYQFSLDSAMRDAQYLEQHTLASKLGHQNERVQRLEAKLAYYEEQRDKIKYLAERIDSWFMRHPPVHFVEFDDEEGGTDAPACAMCDAEGEDVHTPECPTATIRTLITNLQELQ